MPPMKHINKLQRLILYVIFTFITVGCANASIVVNVEDDYSGNLQIVFGVEQRMLAMMRSQGSDPFEEAGNNMDEEWVAEEQWIANDMQWMSFARDFKDLPELRYVIARMPILSGLTLDQNGREISFMGAIEPMNTGESGATQMDSMMAGMINFSLNVRLPGEMVETNGVLDRDTNLYRWQINPLNRTEVSIKNEISIIDYIRYEFGFLAILIVALVVVALLAIPLVYSARQKRNQSMPEPIFR